MPASRLISILLLLQVRGRMSADELAEALEVSPRTIYRDVEALGAAGIPVYGEAGHGGGYRLLDGFRTRLTGLTAGEAGSLGLAALPRAAADLGLEPEARAAWIKMVAALPPPLRQAAAEFDDRFYVDVPAWYHEAARTPALAATADAIRRSRVIRIRYLRWAQPHEVTRTVRPHGLVLKAGHWYLVAQHRAGMRTYRVDRIRHLVVSEESFARAAGFRLAAYWDVYLTDLAERRHTGTATLHIGRSAFGLLPYTADPAVAEAARRTATALPDPDRLEVVIPTESLDHAAAEILRLGTDVEVVAPPELRDRVAAVIRSLAARYAVGRPGDVMIEE
ncbi:WYL domain-containing protein [Actinoplanes sp. NPDC051411]|uniref:helix-turn-helix transcriptional regulator n=1 Tax=Actinoplanes sp. NPDC051411 TaxID=3155522 RepID=UPI003446B639